MAVEVSALFFLVILCIALQIDSRDQINSVERKWQAYIEFYRKYQ